FPPLVGPARRLPEELLLRRRRAVRRVLDSGGRSGGAAALARACLRDGARLRRRRRDLAHGSRRAFLHGLGVRRRVQFSGDLVRARMALPLAAYADLGRGGGTRARTVRGKANLGPGLRRSLGTSGGSNPYCSLILSLGLQAEHELPIHASGGIPIEADVRSGRVRVPPGALQRLLQEQAL